MYFKMNTLTAIFERCMSASIARTATVVVWREYRDMDGLGGAEMLEHDIETTLRRRHCPLKVATTPTSAYTIRWIGASYI